MFNCDLDGSKLPLTKNNLKYYIQQVRNNVNVYNFRPRITAYAVSITFGSFAVS